MQKISTGLWFEKQADEAAGFYVSRFGDSRILDVSRFDDGGHKARRCSARRTYAPIPVTAWTSALKLSRPGTACPVSINLNHQGLNLRGWVNCSETELLPLSHYS
ncbi:UNVERIFIED_ORG: hypothetical protein ABID57_000771 [Arthrobacter sp. UYEF1]